MQGSDGVMQGSCRVQMAQCRVREGFTWHHAGFKKVSNGILNNYVGACLGTLREQKAECRVQEAIMWRHAGTAAANDYGTHEARHLTVA